MPLFRLAQAKPQETPHCPPPWILPCPCGLKKQPRGQPCYPCALYPYALVSVSIVFSSASVCSLLAALARKSRLFRTILVYEVHSASSGSKAATFECGARSTFWQLQLESRNCSVVYAVHFGSSGSKVGFSVQVSVVKCSMQSTFWQLKGRLQGSGLDSAWRLMSWVSVGYRFGYRFGPCKFMIPQSWLATTTWT